MIQESHTIGQNPPSSSNAPSKQKYTPMWRPNYKAQQQNKLMGDAIQEFLLTASKIMESQANQGNRIMSLMEDMRMLKKQLGMHALGKDKQGRV